MAGGIVLIILRVTGNVESLKVGHSNKRCEFHLFRVTLSVLHILGLGKSQGLKWVLITFTFHTGRNEFELYDISLQTGPEFLLFLFNLWKFWVLLPQSGAPLLLTVLLIRENLLFRDTERELQGVWRKGERSRGYLLDIRVGINSKLKLEPLVNT